MFFADFGKVSDDYECPINVSTSLYSFIALISGLLYTSTGVHACKLSIGACFAFNTAIWCMLEAERELYEAWMENERSVAPNGVNKMFNSDFAYWWYDTNLKMLRTAYGAAAITLICAAVVVLVSSRSFVLTFFAAISIAYVLVASTACLVRWCTVVVQSLCCLVTCDTSFSSSIAFLYCIIFAGCTWLGAWISWIHFICHFDWYQLRFHDPYWPCLYHV